jgi:nucleolar GTP-binding protein
VVVFIADPSGHCGFSLEEQIHVLNDLQSWISLPVLMVYNKMDLTGPQEGALSMSTLTGEGVLDVLERLVTALEKSEEHKNRLDQAS